MHVTGPHMLTIAGAGPRVQYVLEEDKNLSSCALLGAEISLRTWTLGEG